MSLLHNDDLLKLHEAIISATLSGSRPALLARIPTHFTATLPVASVPGDQVLMDVDALNATGALLDGTMPFTIWLENAIALAGGRQEEVVFSGALDRVRAAATQRPTTASGSPPHRTEPPASTAAPAAPTFHINISNSTVGSFGAGTGVTVTGTVTTPTSTATSPRAPEAVQRGSGRTPAAPTPSKPATPTAGAPETLASVYLSYGDGDLPFAEMLFEALEAAGVPVFFRHEHAVPGAKLHRSARKSIREYEHVILLCSERSLPASSVISELDEMLSREFDDGASERIIPVLLDDFAFGGWTPRQADIRQTILDRVPLDMKAADRDAGKFQKALKRLLGALRG